MEKRQRKKIGAAIMLLGFLVFVVWKKEDGRRAEEIFLLSRAG